MPSTVEVIAIGDELGIILPDELVDRLNLKIGDTVSVSETPSGIQLSKYDEEAEAIGIAE